MGQQKDPLYGVVEVAEDGGGWAPATMDIYLSAGDAITAAEWREEHDGKPHRAFELRRLHADLLRALEHADRPSREYLYFILESHIRHALTSLGGSSVEAWRDADLDALMERVMLTVRAGLNPRLDSEAVESGVIVARQRRHGLPGRGDRMTPCLCSCHLNPVYGVCDTPGGCGSVGCRDGRIATQGGSQWAGGALCVTGEAL